MIDQLSRCHPRITINLLTAQTQALHRKLFDRELDLLIARRFGALADERLDFDALFNDSYVVVGSAQNPLTRRGRISLAELVGESWVLPGFESVPSAVLADAMRVAGLNYPHATVVTNSAEVRMKLLMSGRFVTIFSTSALRFSDRRSGLKVLPVKLLMSAIPVGIMTLKNCTLSPVTRLFIEHAREVAKPLAMGKR